MTQKPPKPVTGPFLEKFNHFESASLLSWLLPLRKAGLVRFNELGFPTLQDEDWRFTNLAPLTKLQRREAQFVEAHNWASRRCRTKTGVSPTLRLSPSCCSSPPLNRQTIPPPKPPWKNTYSPICPVPGSFL